MFYFTKQEKMVLSLLVLIALSGAILKYAFAKYPALIDLVNLIDSDRIYGKVDINTASAEELIAVPYIGEYTAANMILYRQEHGPFMSLEQVKNVKGIRDKNYERFYKYLCVNK